MTISFFACQVFLAAPNWSKREKAPNHKAGADSWSWPTGVDFSIQGAKHAIKDKTFMRVLYFHHDAAPSGASKSLSLVIRQLTQMGWQATVAIQESPSNRAVVSLFQECGATVIEAHDLRPFHGSTVAPNTTVRGKLYAMGGYIPTLRRAHALIRKIKPDIVHLNSTSIVAAGHAAKLYDSNIPVISHVREPILTNPWGELLRRLNWRYVDHFISIDNEGARSLRVEDRRFTVIRNSAPSGYFDLTHSAKQEARARLGWHDDRLTLLSLARPIPANGALELVRLASGLSNELSQSLRLVIAGLGDPPLQQYEVSLRTAIEACPCCIGAPFTNDVLRYIAACDALIVPFTTNHSARSVFEGAAAGRPAIITDLPNLRELIIEGETGLTFGLSDPRSLEQAIEVLSQKDKRAEMGENAKQFARRNFDESLNAQRVSAIYTKLTQDERIDTNVE